MTKDELWTSVDGGCCSVKPGVLALDLLCWREERREGTAVCLPQLLGEALGLTTVL